MKKSLVLLLAALLALALGGCNTTVSATPPDLTGNWKQENSDGLNFYQIATITDDTIQCYWYLPEYDEEHLYWTGTFTPPADGREPYTWTSQNNLENPHLEQWAERDDTKTFTYEKGQLSYNVNMAHLRMTYALERVE